MGMGQLNPLRTIAPQQTVSTSALAQIMGNQDKAIQSIGKGLTGLGEEAGQFGRQQNTSKLTDLIARSQIDDLDADGIRKLTGEAGIDTSRLTQDGTDEFSKLIERKDAFAKTKGGVILKDGTFKLTTGKDGVVPEEVRDDSFYNGWKGPDKTFNNALKGTTLENRKTLIDGYLDGQLRAKELFRDDNKGIPRSTGFTFMYKNKPITAQGLRDIIATNQAVIQSPSETPIEKEKAKLEIESVENVVKEQNDKEEEVRTRGLTDVLFGRSIIQEDTTTKPFTKEQREEQIAGNTQRSKSIQNTNERNIRKLLEKNPDNKNLQNQLDLLMGKKNSVSKTGSSVDTLLNGTNNGKADTPLNTQSELKKMESKEEGGEINPYPDGKKGGFSVGYGHFLLKGEKEMYEKLTPTQKLEQNEKWFQEDLIKHTKRAKTLIPKYSSLSKNLQKNLLFATYRGSLGQSTDTVRLINEGKFKKASIEFLDSDEYRSATGELKKRMENVAKALRQEKV